MGSTENIEVLRNILPHTNEKVCKRCVIGVEGIRWYFITLINQWTGNTEFRVFKTMEDALDWLVAD